jgi:hypothetical protein
MLLVTLSVPTASFGHFLSALYTSHPVITACFTISNQLTVLLLSEFYKLIYEQHRYHNLVDATACVC